MQLASVSVSLCVAAVCCLQVTTPAICAVPSESEYKAVAARRAIRSGQLEITVRQSRSQGERTRVYEEELEVAFDGDRIRIERRRVAPASERAADGKPAKATYVATQSDFLYYSDVVGSDGVARMGQMGRRDQIGNYRSRIVDPRKIGMVPDPFDTLHAVHLDTLVGRPDRTRSTVETKVIDGENVEQIEYERKDGCLIRIWIVPKKDYAVVRCEIEASRKSGTLLDRAESKLKLYDGVWFPETVVVRRFKAGVLVDEDITMIRRASFNHAVDPTLFTVKALGMRLGSKVLDLATSSYMDWDGERLVPVSARSPEPQNSEPRSRRLWLYLSLSFGIAAAIVVFVLLRRNAAASR